MGGPPAWETTPHRKQISPLQNITKGVRLGHSLEHERGRRGKHIGQGQEIQEERDH
jgi:hypothetical protein